jgi:hypothetical protein
VKVYVVTMGCYSGVGVVGVYSTPEKAMAGRKGKFRYEDTFKTWSNDLEWDLFTEITEYELDKA